MNEQTLNLITYLAFFDEIERIEKSGGFEPIFKFFRELGEQGTRKSAKGVAARGAKGVAARGAKGVAARGAKGVAARGAKGGVEKGLSPVDQSASAFINEHFKGVSVPEVQWVSPTRYSKYTGGLMQRKVYLPPQRQSWIRKMFSSIGEK